MWWPVHGNSGYCGRNTLRVQSVQEEKPAGFLVEGTGRIEMKECDRKGKKKRLGAHLSSCPANSGEFNWRHFSMKTREQKCRRREPKSPAHYDFATESLFIPLLFHRLQSSWETRKFQTQVNQYDYLSVCQNPAENRETAIIIFIPTLRYSKAAIKLSEALE